MFEPEGSNPKLCDDCFLSALSKSEKKANKIPKNQEINLAMDKLIFNYIYSIKGISDRDYERIATEWIKIKAEEKELGEINPKIDKLIFGYINSLNEVPDKTYVRIVKKWDKIKQERKQNDIKKNRPKV